MSSIRAWSAYPITYRAREMKQLARWVSTNTSGSVVGLAGAGKSNLLGFLGHRPDALQAHIPSIQNQVALISVDLNNLPANDLATLLRVMLRSFYEAGDQFEREMQDTITTLYRENQASHDPFLSQSALRELLLLCQARKTRIVLVLDRFDKFCQQATLEMTDSLRGLRDSFKGTLSYIVGMRQEVIYLSDPAVLGELYEILDTNVCWVGAMNESDGRKVIAEETLFADTPPSEADIEKLLSLTGSYPALLKAACHWWLTKPGLSAKQWLEALLAERSMQNRLGEIWGGLSQEEQQLLLAIHGGGGGKAHGTKMNKKTRQDLKQQHLHMLARLAAKGVGLHRGDSWHLTGDLLAAYVSAMGGDGRGKLWIDRSLNVIYQGETPLGNLAPLENALLRFLVTHPHIRHTYTELIEGTWPEDVSKEGVANEALYQVVRGLRVQIEPTPSKPCYIINWRGQPEGGYQCFPEGRPG